MMEGLGPEAKPNGLKSSKAEEALLRERTSPDLVSSLWPGMLAKWWNLMVA